MIDAAKLEVIERIVKQSILWAHKNGIRTNVKTWGVFYDLVRKRWVPHSNKCACGFGCVLLFAGHTNHSGAALSLNEVFHLDFSWDLYESFTRGWDGKVIADKFDNVPLFELGQRMRAFADALPPAGS